MFGTIARSAHLLDHGENEKGNSDDSSKAIGLRGRFSFAVDEPCGSGACARHVRS
jgi:hypothetical protein